MSIKDRIRELERQIEYYEDMLECSKDPSFRDQIKNIIDKLKLKLYRLIRKMKLNKILKH